MSKISTLGVMPFGATPAASNQKATVDSSDYRGTSSPTSTLRPSLELSS